MDANLTIEQFEKYAKENYEMGCRFAVIRQDCMCDLLEEPTSSLTFEQITCFYDCSSLNYVITTYQK